MSASFPALRHGGRRRHRRQGLAEFYRELFGYLYRSGDEPPPMVSRTRRAGLARAHDDRQRQARHARPTGRRAAADHVAGRRPSATPCRHDRSDEVELADQRDRALSWARGCCSFDRRIRVEPLYVFADPAGHPFCIFVSPDHPGRGGSLPARASFSAKGGGRQRRALPALRHQPESLCGAAAAADA